MLEVLLLVVVIVVPAVLILNILKYKGAILKRTSPKNRATSVNKCG